MTRLTGRQIEDAGLDGWTYLACVLGGLVARIRTDDFATGLRVVAAIGAAAEEIGHHPDVDLRYDHVDVRLWSHGERGEHGVTERDVRLARAISTIASAAGAALGSTGVSRIELALDTPDASAVEPFWRAVLGIVDQADATAQAARNDGSGTATDKDGSGTTSMEDGLPNGAVAGLRDVVDQHGNLPAVWFQPSRSGEPRQRWHPDVWVEPAQVQPRIDAAVAVGGRLVSDEGAPSFWLLADPDGNQMCLCTWQARD